MDFEDWITNDNWAVNPIMAERFDDEIDYILWSKEEGDTVEIDINSIGGSWIEGFKMRNAAKALNNKIPVYMVAVGEIGSIASTFYMAVPKEQRLVKEGSNGFIHNPIAGANGNANEHEKLAQILRGKEDEMSEIYAADMNITVEKAKEYMNGDTYFSPKQMIESGFAGAMYDEETTRETNLKIAAIFKKSCIGEGCKL